jgi:hypothetical protein
MFQVHLISSSDWNQQWFLDNVLPSEGFADSVSVVAVFLDVFKDAQGLHSSNSLNSSNSADISGDFFVLWGLTNHTKEVIKEIGHQNLRLWNAVKKHMFFIYFFLTWLHVYSVHVLEHLWHPQNWFDKLLWNTAKLVQEIRKGVCLLESTFLISFVWLNSNA